MKVVRVAVETRLPNLETDLLRYGIPHLIVNLPRYGCPSCGEYTVFSVREPERSPFDPELKRQFDELTGMLSPYEQGVADFFCRVCNRPVRVVYRFEEFHMGSFFYFAEALFETSE